MKKTFFALLFFFSFSAFPSFSTAASKAEAFQFANRLSYYYLESVLSPVSTRSSRWDMFGDMIRRNWDNWLFAKIVLGGHYRLIPVCHTSGEIRYYFLQALEKNLITLSLQQLEKYVGYTVRFKSKTGVLRVSSNVVDYLVYSDLIKKGEPPVSLVWRVRNHKGIYFLIDLAIGDFSPTAFYHREFHRILSDDPTDWIGLINFLSQSTFDSGVLPDYEPTRPPRFIGQVTRGTSFEKKKENARKSPNLKPSRNETPCPVQQVQEIQVKSKRSNAGLPHLGDGPLVIDHETDPLSVIKLSGFLSLLKNALDF